jgi:predicted nucleic acid-binding protein
MTTFVDTSALFAVLDADDENHLPANETWEELVTQEEVLVCTNYILVESFALVQHRLGMDAIRTLQEDILPLVNVEWMDSEAHHNSVMALLVADRRGLSLVDCASFVTMRRLSLSTAFTFDRDFEELGFETIP